MSLSRRSLARLANVGLVVSGLIVVVILGSGGTTFIIAGMKLHLESLSWPVQIFGLFAALRLLTASRSGGIEGRLVCFFARWGLPPRDNPSTLGSAARFGAKLGLGSGLVVAAADLTHLVLLEGALGWGPLEILQIVVLALSSGGILGLMGGWLLGGVVRLVVPGLTRGHPGRYECGRWTAAGLMAFLPMVIYLNPATWPSARTPGALLGTAGVFLLGLGTVFFLVPAALLQARRGRWTLAAGCLGGMGLVAGLAVMAYTLPKADGSSPLGEARLNLLLVTITGLRTSVIGAYQGSGYPTIYLDGLAQKGSVFREAITPSTATASAAASILSGLYPATHGLRENQVLGPTIEGLPQLLMAQGYQTGAFVSCRSLNGRRTRLASLFHEYDDLTGLRDRLDGLVIGGFARRFYSPSRGLTRSTEETVVRFQDWLLGVPHGPWFAWVELGGPGLPAPVPIEVAGQAGVLSELPRQDFPLPSAPTWAPRENAGRPLKEWVWGYLQEVSAADEAVGLLQRTLAARGEIHRTLIVITAEHGIPIGEDGLWFDAGSGLNEAAVRVPWIVSGPGIARGRDIAGPCSLVDMAPTVLGLLGLGGSRFSEGEDLSRYLTAVGQAGRDPRSGPVFFESSPVGAGKKAGLLHGVRMGTWKLVRYPDGSEALFQAAEGFELEVSPPRGNTERMRQDLSDMLTRRLAEAAMAGGRPRVE